MKFDAPVPGANLLADTRNYPWHRPPDIVDYDEAVDYMIERLTQPEQTELIYSLLDIEVSVTTVTSALLMQAIAKGKLPIDLAILIAGPVARYIQIIAESEGFKYDMGTDDSDRVKITPTLLKQSLGIIEDEETGQVAIIDDDIPTEGLMGRPSLEETEAAPADEQAAMLGMMEAPEEGDEDVQMA